MRANNQPGSDFRNVTVLEGLKAWKVAEGGDEVQLYIAELHVHTVLSPCAEVEMIPPWIVRAALDKGINMIAITDHNASANVSAVMKAAAGTGLVVLPGMEVQTREEVHVVCLFDTLDQLASWQALVTQQLPALENNVDLFGEQFVVDETGEFIRREAQLLLTSANLGLKQVVEEVTRLGGMAIPAHVDRKAFSLIANLGFVPPDVAVAALEITRHVTPEQVRQRFPQVAGYPLVQSGDAHRLEELLGANQFLLAAPTISELRLALQNREGRWLRVGRTERPI